MKTFNLAVTGVALVSTAFAVAHDPKKIMEYPLISNEMLFQEEQSVSDPSASINCTIGGTRKLFHRLLP